jgi:hypothetical protein
MESFIVEIDPDGNMVSTITQENIFNISSIAIDDAGNLIVSGACAGIDPTFNGVQFQNTLAYASYLVRYDENRNPLWVKFVEDVTCIFTEVEVDEDQNIYWSGPLDIAAQFDDIQAEGPAWVYDFFLVKVSPDGEYLWLKEVPQVLTGDATTGKLNYLEYISDGSIVLTGFTRGDVDWGDDLVSESTDLYYDIILWEYDTDGNLNWVTTAGGEGFDRGQSLSCDDEGNIYITGNSAESVTFDTIIYVNEDLTHLFLAKLDRGSPVNVPEANAQEDFYIYPNPATHTIRMSRTDLRSVAIFDVVGTRIREVKPANGEISVNDLPSGLYFLKAELLTGDFLSKSFIRQ